MYYFERSVLFETEELKYLPVYDTRGFLLTDGRLGSDARGSDGHS